MCPWNIIHGKIVKKITKHYHCCMLRGSIDLFYIYYDWCDKMDSKVSPSFGSPLLSTNPLVIRVLNAHEHEEPKARRIISTWEKHNYKVFFLVYHFIADLLYDPKNVILGESVFGPHILPHIQSVPRDFLTANGHGCYLF